MQYSLPMNCPTVLGDGVQAHKRRLHFLHPLGLHWLGWLRYFACFLQCILQWWPHFVVVEEGVHMAPQRLRWAPQNGGGMAAPLPMLALVHHRSNSAAPGFLQMVAHNFVAHLLLGPWENLLL
jgi:hypothetical protein